MADYHVLTQDNNKKSVNVVFHVPIPAISTNAANITWRQAIVLEQGGSVNIVSVLPGISVVEDTQLKAGELFEVSRSVKFSSINLNSVQRKTAIEVYFGKLVTDLVTEKQITLEWIGYEGSVA